MMKRSYNEGYDTSENSVRDFKSPWFLTWFLISKLWFLISKLISDFQVDFWFPNWFLISKLISDFQVDFLFWETLATNPIQAIIATSSRPLFELLEAKVVITLEEFDLGPPSFSDRTAGNSHLDLISSWI